METSGIILTVVVVTIIMLAIWFLLLRSARRVNLTRASNDQKPEWMRTTPPPETIAATKADGEGVTLYDYDEGESVAAPFAEQIEDVLRSQMSADPYLNSLDVDFGTDSNGALEIKVGDKVYKTIAEISDLRLREAITQAVATYNQRNK